LPWQAELTQRNHLILKRSQVSGDINLTSKSSDRDRQQATQNPKSPDPVLLEIFNNLFRSIAEQMGITLQNTSSSVNIKERLDFSCAIFDQQGKLVANAPHIPVHLGSMSESVRSLIAVHGDTLEPGDVYVLNNPYNGGTHLPDITVITPVFVEDSPSLPLSSTLPRGDTMQTSAALPLVQCHPPAKRWRKKGCC
jgi:5-oxoprolinase (ATP-hydrolysing)